MFLYFNVFIMSLISWVFVLISYTYQLGETMCCEQESLLFFFSVFFFFFFFCLNDLYLVVIRVCAIHVT